MLLDLRLHYYIPHPAERIADSLLRPISRGSPWGGCGQALDRLDARWRSVRGYLWSRTIACLQLMSHPRPGNGQACGRYSCHFARTYREVNKGGWISFVGHREFSDAPTSRKIRMGRWSHSSYEQSLLLGQACCRWFYLWLHSHRGIRLLDCGRGMLSRRFNDRLSSYQDRSRLVSLASACRRCNRRESDLPPAFLTWAWRSWLC